LREMPGGLQVTYSSMQAGLFEGSLTLNQLKIGDGADSNRRVDIDRVVIRGLRYFALLFSRRIDPHELKLEGTEARVHWLKGQVLRLGGIELDGEKRSLRIDSLKIAPVVDKYELGRRAGHQVDYIEGSSGGIWVAGLDFEALRQNHYLIADSMGIEKNHIYVFRDRRLPREEDRKAMPAELLKELPVTVRVKSVRIGTTNFVYEEFPRKGNKTGILRVVRMRGQISPLINHPVKGDPAYITMRIGGSLMGSGWVTATTGIPLHKGDPYEVEGAFHELDVTALNPSAENLGHIHLESGRLNSLAFWFRMDEEKSTGKIVGEYHDLVAEKLKENSDGKKVDKLKSFFLKHVIIPKDKDKSLAVEKRTGEVDYKHDPSRYFSYYLLHSLLVGVKSSFSLGFLLPG
ncbi:MAG TPA: hypothetical protein VI233_11525, partial [Puia sp.]